MSASIKLGLFIGGLGWLFLGFLGARRMSLRTGKDLKVCFESFQWLVEPLRGQPTAVWLFGWVLAWAAVFIPLAVP